MHCFLFTDFDHKIMIFMSSVYDSENTLIVIDCKLNELQVILYHYLYSHQSSNMNRLIYQQKKSQAEAKIPLQGNECSFNLASGEMIHLLNQVICIY